MVLKKAIIIQKQENIYLLKFMVENLGSPGDSDSKESACSTGDSAQSLDQEDALRKGMAAHSSTLARRIPWTGDPGRL